MTRDFTSFATRFVAAPLVERAPAPVAAKPSIPMAQKLSVLVVGKPAAPEVAKAAAPEVAKAAAPIAPAAAPSDGSAKRVSVNTAGIEELTAVKGLSGSYFVLLFQVEGRPEEKY